MGVQWHTLKSLDYQILRWSKIHLIKMKKFSSNAFEVTANRSFVMICSKRNNSYAVGFRILLCKNYSNTDTTPSTVLRERILDEFAASTMPWGASVYYPHVKLILGVKGLQQALLTQQVGSRARIRTLGCAAKSLVLTSASHLSSNGAEVLVLFKNNSPSFRSPWVSWRIKSVQRLYTDVK